MNKTRLRMLVMALTLTALLGLAGTAMARCGGYGGGGMGPALTQEQIATVTKLHDDFYAATETIRQQMIIKQAELQAELSGSKPNPQKLQQFSTELGTLEGKMLVERNALRQKMTAAGIPTGSMGSCNGMMQGGMMHGGMHGGGMMHGGMMSGNGMMHMMQGNEMMHKGMHNNGMMHNNNSMMHMMQGNEMPQQQGTGTN